MELVYKQFLKRFFANYRRKWMTPLLPALMLTIGTACSTPAKTKTEKTHEVVSDEASARKTYTEEQQSADITNRAANKVDADYFTEVEFKPGSRHLNDTSRFEIQNLIARAARNGKVKDVKVLSWADEEYPSKEVKKLSKVQRDIATDRNKNIESYVKSIQKVSVETYNMAERPNTLQRWFNTTDEKLKSSLVAAGLPTTADDPQYPSKASHSVVLVILK